MTDRADASCVYVKRALLTQLEREKRGLRWQLARAAKAAETHAADVAAYEAKLKDLLTIVEMNKSVADKAVKQTYSRESVVQKLQSEKQTLTTQLQRQHTRAVVAMQQRSERRRRRDVWNAWVRVTRWHKDVKTRMRRILERQRRRRLESGFAQWKRIIGARMMDIQPSGAALEPLPSPTSSMCSRSTFSTVSEGLAAHKSLGFATWKAEWHARKRKHRLATQFAQLILVRRVVNAWKQAVRRRNWQNAMTMTAKQRRRQLCFIRWRQWTRRAALGRKALRRILKTQARRVLQREFSLFRLKCTEKCVAEWAEIHKSARNAVEEERNIYALHQDAALQEIQERFTRQELAQRRFLEGQRHQLSQKRRREGLRVWFVRWQKRIELRRMQAQVAKHYAQVHVRRSRVRRVYVAWKQLHEQQKRVKILMQRVICRQQKTLIVRCFHHLTRQLHRQIQRKRRLRLILIRRNKHALIRSWARLHSVILLEEQEACAHLQTRELMTQLQVRETTWQYEAHRLQRVAYRYQLQNALHLGDTKRERQAPFGSRGQEKSWLCSLTEYRRRHRMRWRLQQSRQSLHRRVRRALALSLLLKTLHRQHLRVVRRAFWVWFSRIQRISSVLASIGFAALPWSRPTTSFSGSMLLLALEEMDLKDQTATAEATQRAWQAVDRTLRSFRKQFVHRAFDRWVFLSRIRTRRPVSRRYQLVHPLRSDLIATGRAFLAKLHSIIKRKAFATWKTQYVAWAIDSARQEELELLAALRNVTSYRQTLDPYSRPY
ncbi:hypothetical protein Poli38472_012147 [Pythium oligandrum]|uniref:Sfi1 spindle body domain-containing protein n=1 Tax=Pythium oligandrum TaxID=41045 RepID=A0A8K1CQW9_PYTOL|nr:hypothetical protein Poli38472_012147 [Pythium oligandrum]|eukprot:TMW67031.1 hypothetical protein Poli38472_012147 [Pythium oligandrum]